MTSRSIDGETNINRNPSYFPLFHRKETAITLVALLAIGMAIVGVMGILASLPHAHIAGLGALSKLGMPGSSAFIGGGLVSVLILSVVLYCKRNQSPSDENTTHESLVAERDDDDIYGNSKYIPQQQQQRFQQQKVTKEFVVREDLKHVLDEVLENLELTISVAEHLQNLYGQGDLPNLNTPLVNASQEDLDAYKIQLGLLLLSNEGILDLPLDDIEKLSDSELSLVYFRLRVIDQSTQEKEESIAEEDASEEHSMSLKDLRSLPGKTFVDPQQDSPQKCMGMLTAIQLQELIVAFGQSLESQKACEQFERFLPVSSHEEYLYTEQRLADISPETLFPYLKHFSGALLHLLPVEFFQLEQFPWKEIVSSEEKIAELFKENRRRTEAILSSLDNKIIVFLAPYLKVDHLNSFSKKQLDDERFPWAPFLGQKGIGSALRNLFSQKTLTLKEFPWDLLAKKENQNEIDELLTPNYLLTSQIVEGLGEDGKKSGILAPYLKVDHLKSFSKEQLEDQRFPWAPFLGQKGIGSALYSLVSQRGVSLKEFPWKEFVEKAKQAGVDGLLPTTYTNTTGNILQTLNEKEIEILAPSLKKEHLPCFTKPQLESKEFPWVPFLEKEGIGSALYSLVSQRGVSLKEFPWKELVEKAKQAGVDGLQ